MSDPKNNDPFAPWNGYQKDDPFAPHNGFRKDDPFAPWNDPFGTEDDLSNDERRDYNLPPKRRNDYYEENY